MAKSLRSEDTSIQGSCSARADYLWVLVQVHFLDPYKHFGLFLLASVHVLDLYKHSDSAWIV